MNFIFRTLKALRRSSGPTSQRTEPKLLAYANELDITCLFVLFGLVASASGETSPEQAKEVQCFMERQVPSQLHTLAKECFHQGQMKQAEKNLIIHYAFQLYWNKKDRWLEPLQVLNALLMVALVDKEFSALEEYIIDCTRATFGIHSRSYWILRDTLAERAGVHIEHTGDSFAGAVDWAARGADRLRKHGQSVKIEEPAGNPKNECDIRIKAYMILNLEPGASQQKVKENYRKLVKQYHPDILNSGAASDLELKEAIAHFCQIQEAYEFLSQNGG